MSAMDVGGSVGAGVDWGASPTVIYVVDLEGPYASEPAKVAMI